MATSGSYNFTVTRGDIILEALTIIGEVGEGFGITAYQGQRAASALNMLVKQWQGQDDFAPGLKVWTRKQGTLFLVKGQYEYDLGLTGDHFTTDEYVETTLTAAASATDSTLTLDSTGMSDGDYVGVVLDNDSMHWTTINGTPGATITLTDQMPSAAAIGNKVYTYTNKAPRPLTVKTVLRRNSNGDDDPLSDMVTRDAYDMIPDKDSTGTPTQYLYETQLDDGKLILFASPEDSDDILKVTFLRPIQDLDAANDDLDYPQHWFRALKYQLAIDCAPTFHKPLSQDWIVLRNEAVMIAQHFDGQQTLDHFEPGRED